jgi:hypothetical protein
LEENSENPFSYYVENIQLSPDCTRAIAKTYNGWHYLIDTSSAKSLWSAPDEEHPEDFIGAAFSQDGKYVFGLTKSVTKSVTKSKQPLFKLFYAVQSSDGSVVKDVQSLTKARQKEINTISASLVSEKKPLPAEVESTRKGLYIKRKEDMGNLHIPTLEKIEGCWISPDKGWLLFNGVNLETTEGGNGFSTGWIYNFHTDPPWIRGESAEFQSVTFDKNSNFLANNTWAAGLEGPGMTEILRLPSPDQIVNSPKDVLQPQKLELPLEDESLFRSIIGRNNVLAVSSQEGVSFFDLPTQPFLQEDETLKVDESFLELAEYIGGWRINSKGEYVPVPYSEQHAAQLKLLRK